MSTFVAETNYQNQYPRILTLTLVSETNNLNRYVAFYIDFNFDLGSGNQNPTTMYKTNVWCIGFLNCGYWARVGFEAPYMSKVKSKAMAFQLPRWFPQPITETNIAYF